VTERNLPAGEDVQLRPAQLRDVWAIHRLERSCFQRDAWPWIDIFAVLLFPETVRLKAVAENKVVGFVVGDRRRRQGLGWIATLGVHQDYRRRGIGRRLLEACERELDTRRVRLTLRRSNHIAMDLYKSAGYTPVETWKRYYRDGEDGIVMEKLQRSVSTEIRPSFDQ